MTDIDTREEDDEKSPEDWEREARFRWLLMTATPEELVEVRRRLRAEGIMIGYMH